MPSYFDPNNKSITVRQLKNLLETVKQKDLDKPVVMSSDEEGNDMLQLWRIEIHKGQVTLWPAHT